MPASKLNSALQRYTHSFTFNSAFSIQHSAISRRRPHGCRSCRAILDPVHRLVGGLDQPLGGRGHVGQRRHADRDGQRDAQPVAARETGAPRADRECARRPTTAPSLPVSGRMSANSSPPNRATMSVSRALARITPAASTSARLPNRWPCVSLIDLNPSRSMNSSDSGRPLRERPLGFAAQHLLTGSASCRAASGRR